MADFSVYTVDPDTGLVTFRLFDSTLSRQPHEDRGILALAQRAILTVRRNLGDDAFSPLYGGSINGLVGQRVIYDEANLRAEALRVVQESERQMKEEQSNEPIPNTDLVLRELRFLDFYFDVTDATRMVLEFEVSSQTGDTVAVPLRL